MKEKKDLKLLLTSSILEELNYVGVMGGAKAAITESVKYANEREQSIHLYHHLEQYNLNWQNNVLEHLLVRVQLTEQHKTLKIIFNHLFKVAWIKVKQHLKE